MNNRTLKILLVIAIALLVLGCYPEDMCGIVTDMYENSLGDYIVKLDDQPHKVDFSSYIDANVGDYMCVTY